LVERLLCKQDVNGSSPLISICDRQKNKEKRNESAPVKDSLLKSEIFRKHLENCIIYQKKSGRNFMKYWKLEIVEDMERRQSKKAK
jgi:hypothetical protein